MRIGLYSRRTLGTVAVAATLALAQVGAAAAQSQGLGQAAITPFVQAVAENAAGDRGIAAFYRAAKFAPFWTAATPEGQARRQAFLDAVQSAGDHGLPGNRYSAARITDLLEAARTGRDLGEIEVEMSRLFVRYARDISTGVLEPNKIDKDIKRQMEPRDANEILTGLAEADHPAVFIRSLPPKTSEYARLMREKLAMQRQIERGGWGPKVPARSLKPGQSGNAVIALRDRLIAMGYLDRTPTMTYDAAIEKAIFAFQEDHGLPADGVAGPETVQAINVPMTQRLGQIIVAMERERWLPRDRGERHILVNLPDFQARIVDNDKVTFKTRSVVGKADVDRRTPEFSDVMEYMEINPYWNIPRSILAKEYWPGIPGNFEIVDGRGQIVPRNRINFSRYTARSFPFNVRQPPSRGNALGLVKFMFPNPYNIYLHDTPAKSLFDQRRRDYSYGCIRLKDPFDFAYTILSRQVDDPVRYFNELLDSGRNIQVRLEKQIPVHLIYRTAFTTAKGHTNYRNDVYGRDTKILAALLDAGVELRASSS